MDFDYSKLEGRIKEFGLTQEKFAHSIGITPATLSLKLSNKGFFNQREIRKARKVLQLEAEEVGTYFFAEKVQEI